jgi:hypothetical protein
MRLILLFWFITSIHVIAQPGSFSNNHNLYYSDSLITVLNEIQDTDGIIKLSQFILTDITDIPTNFDLNIYNHTCPFKQCVLCEKIMASMDFNVLLLRFLPPFTDEFIFENYDVEGYCIEVN